MCAAPGASLLPCCGLSKNYHFQRGTSLLQFLWTLKKASSLFPWDGQQKNSAKLKPENIQKKNQQHPQKNINFLDPACGAAPKRCMSRSVAPQIWQGLSTNVDLLFPVTILEIKNMFMDHPARQKKVSLRSFSFFDHPRPGCPATVVQLRPKLHALNMATMLHCGTTMPHHATRSAQSTDQPKTCVANVDDCDNCEAHRHLNPCLVVSFQHPILEPENEAPNFLSSETLDATS